VIARQGFHLAVGEHVGARVADVAEAHLFAEQQGDRQGGASAGHPFDHRQVGILKGLPNQILKRHGRFLALEVEHPQQRRLGETPGDGPGRDRARHLA
jgi:hypothetical protein